MRLSPSSAEAFLSVATRAVAVVGLGLLMVFATSTLLDGLLRGLANRPIESVRDIGGLVVAMAMACCIPLGLWERHNITITVIDKLVGTRFGQLLTAFAAVIVTVVMLAFAWEMHAYAGKMLRASERTVMLGIPAAPFWYVVAVILWWAALLQVLVACAEIARVFGWKPAAAPAGDDAGVM
jgi:TRAP-type C4-dicarboxylate transport system permease small subunit